MKLVPLLLILGAVVLETILERRRLSTQYYLYIRRAKRRVWAGRVFYGGLVASSLWASYYYPNWLKVACYSSVAFAEAYVFIRSTKAYYQKISSANRIFGYRSYECRAIETMINADELLVVIFTQTLLTASFFDLLIDDWQPIVAITAGVWVYFVPISLLYWLSNRRIYRNALEEMTKREDAISSVHDGI